MYWTFFIFVWCSCIQPVLMHNVSWDLVTSPVVFGKPVELRCTVKLKGNASCCSQLTRIWSQGSKQILTNGITSLPLKYMETIDAPNKQFILIINDLSKEDVDVVYTCAYGNRSPEKTLTQNDSFEYHPTESECPVKIHNGELVGTLIVNMSAPHPSVTAQYGDSNFTSNLTTIITPVAGSTKFYTINSSLKGKATCRNNENFTLSVLTGVTTTNICNNVTLCTVGIHDGQCRKCTVLCLVWSVPGIVLPFLSLVLVLMLHDSYGWPSERPKELFRSDEVTGLIEMAPSSGLLEMSAPSSDDSYRWLSERPKELDRSDEITGPKEMLAPSSGLLEMSAPSSDDSYESSSERPNELDRSDEITDLVFLAKKQQMISVVSSVVLDVLAVIPIGLCICPCIYGLEYVTIVLGEVTYYIPAAIILYMKIADKRKLLSLLVLSFATQLVWPYLLYKWYKLNLNRKKLAHERTRSISSQSAIIVDLTVRKSL